MNTKKGLRDNKMNICLVGNQNCGKTTLFNCLTESNQKIGNWPGVTVEKKTGIIKETNYELTDLPGVYSLNPYTDEEKITRDYIFNDKPDMIINIIDATCLERSLYLTTQLLELNTKLVLVLNMTDILEKKGISIDIKQLQDELKVKICEISALKQIGIEELLKCINEETKTIHKSNLKNICENCKTCIFKNRNSLYEENITSRYGFIEKITQRCLRKNKKWISTTEVLDKIFLNKFFAFPIFILTIFLIYFLSVDITQKYTIEFTENFMFSISGMIQKLLIKIHTPQWIQSLIIDGVITGMTSVLTFGPQLAILFTCISILESTGYMARIAFLLDNYFRKIGLSGKAIIPFIIASGCSVSGIMSSRFIENSKEREKLAVLVPFVPCSAKLPIIALFSNYFFKEKSGIMSTFIYFFSVIVIIIASKIMGKFKYFSSNNEFILELPDYRIPNIKYIIRDVSEKTFSFIKRAGTTIVLSSIFVWFLLSFSINLNYGVNIEESILAIVGKTISWVFYPMIGVNSWQATVSIIQGLVAKEQVVSTMSIITGMEKNTTIFNNRAFGFFTPISAFTFIIFNLFSAPCLATIATMKNELNSFRKMLITIAFQITLAWILSTIIYQFYILIF